MTKSKSKTEIQWDNYWKENNDIEKVYSKIAKFYRINIIKGALNFFISSNFTRNSSLLHTGCGTGQVDSDLTDKYQITALDVSGEALELYRKTNGPKSKLIKSDVMDIKLKSNSFDGIYNLGLMEHFSKKENETILKEFHRLLKNEGKIVLFWPPKYGISVMFLNSLHFLLNKVLRLNIRLHPDEISLISKKEDIDLLMKKTGFKIKTYYFGPKDLFTHRIIVAIKI